MTSRSAGGRATRLHDVATNRHGLCVPAGRGKLCGHTGISLVCTSGITGVHHAGCSKRPDFSPAQPQRAETRPVPSKAAASEEAKRYIPHFVWAARPCHGSWRTGKPPTTFPSSEKLLLNVEPLSDARTPLPDFFSILLGACPTLTVLLRQTMHRHLLCFQPRNVLNGFPRIRLRFFRVGGRASAGASFAS